MYLEDRRTLDGKIAEYLEGKQRSGMKKFLDRNDVIIFPDLLYMGNILLAQNLNIFHPADTV
jgi:hypothetical protein